MSSPTAPEAIAEPLPPSGGAPVPVESFNLARALRILDGEIRESDLLFLTVRSCLGVVLENPESHFRRNLGVVPRDREVPFAISLTAPALYEFVH